MKKNALLLLLLFSIVMFSQDKNLNYYFNHYEVSITKNYSFQYGFPEKRIVFINSKDSTYLLQIRIAKDLKESRLYDFKKKEVVEFSIDNVTFKMNDLANLKQPKLVDYFFHKHEKKIDNKNVEKVEFERDTILNKTLVHLIRYKNKKFKKIIHEDYFIFQKKQDSEFKRINQDVKDLITAHNVNLNKGESLTKTLCLNDGKISLDIEYLESKNIDYNFIFNRKD